MEVIKKKEIIISYACYSRPLRISSVACHSLGRDLLSSHENTTSPSRWGNTHKSRSNSHQAAALFNPSRSQSRTNVQPTTNLQAKLFSARVSCFSPFKSRLSQPLKPFNGYPWKRSRPSAANGEENEGMLKNQTLDSMFSKDGEERILVSTKRKGLYHKIVPVDSGNIDIAVKCIEEDVIKDLKLNLSASYVLRFVDV